MKNAIILKLNFNEECNHIKTGSQVGTHTSPSIHKFLYTPKSVRDRDQPSQHRDRDQQHGSGRDQQQKSRDGADVERRRAVSTLNHHHHQEMDFRWNTPNFLPSLHQFVFFLLKMFFFRLSHDGAISPLESNGLLKSKETIISLDYVIFSVTRRSRSDAVHSLTYSLTTSWLALTWLMWLWWVRIPSGDLTDVTLVSDDT